MCKIFNNTKKWEKHRHVYSFVVSFSAKEKIPELEERSHQQMYKNRLIWMHIFVQLPGVCCLLSIFTAAANLFPSQGQELANLILHQFMYS